MICLCILFFFLVTTREAYRCPGPEWIAREGTSDCFYVDRVTFSPKVTWDQARLECQIKGGKLVELGGAEELGFIKFLMHRAPTSGWFYSTTHDFWTSLSYASGVWVWAESNRTYSPNDLGQYNPSSSSDFTSSSAANRLRFRVYLEYDSDGDLVPRTSIQTSSRNYICKADYSSRPLCKTEEGWDYSNGRCWMYQTELTNWESAKQRCLGEGGYIAVPSTEAENVRLNRWASGSNVVETWIGISVNKTNQIVASDVILEDGEKLLNSTYITPWATTNLTLLVNNLPSGVNYCGSLKAASFGAIRWSLKADCYDQKTYACETELEKCPYGWDHLGEHCYLVKDSDDEITTWEFAATECMDRGGFLALVTSDVVQTFLEQRIERIGWTSASRPNFWIGLRARSTGEPYWDQPGTSNETVTTGYTNWASGQPGAWSSKCTYMKKPSGASPGYWYPTSCTDRNGYICQARTDKALSSAVTKGVLQCPDGYIKYHGGCYWFSGNLSTNWNDAQKHCRDTKNTDLAEIFTDGENAFLKDRIVGETWIGIRRIPLGDAASGSFIAQYSSGENVPSTAYTNYEYSNLQVNDRFCYSMFPRNQGYGTEAGTWELSACNEVKPFVCLNRGTAVPAPPPSDLYTPECGEGWILLRNNCYKLKFERSTYHFASQICHNEDPQSNLLYIVDSEEGQAIQDLVNGRTSYVPPELSSANSYWTALELTAINMWSWNYRGQARWTVPLVYTNWADGQPSPNMTYSTWSFKCAFLRADDAAEWESSSCTVLRYSICKKPKFVSNTSSTTVAPQLPLGINFTMGCQANWTKIGDHCYYRNESRMNWTEALDSCRRYGKNFFLAELLSATQHREVRILNGAWIGLESRSNPVQPRIFRYSRDGAIPRYTPWLTQLARPSNGENCVASVTTSTYAEPGITAYNCGEFKPAVCMTSVSAVELDVSDCIKAPEDANCQRWGYGFRDTCYYMGVTANDHFGTRQYVTFEQARTFCQSNYGGDLAVINTAEKQEFMMTLLDTWASDYWVGLKEDANPWNAFKKWVTGESVTVTNWAHGEPHPSQMNQGCVAMHSTRSDTRLPGEWYVGPCDEMKFAVCEARRAGYTPPPPVPTFSTTGCPNGWTTADAESKHCFKAYSPASQTSAANADSVKLTWQQAEDSCMDFGGHLATIESQSELNHLLTKVFPGRNNNYNYWIGLYEYGHGVWRWADDTPFGTTTFWHPNINHGDLTMDCVAMDDSQGQWIQQNCQIGWGWICQISKGFYNETDEIHAVTLPSPIVTNSKCPAALGDGTWYYESFTDSCFFVSTASDTWENAENACNAKQAHLASVNFDQQLFLTTVLSRYAATDAHFWIGLRLEDPVTRQHMWVNGDTTRYRNWDNNEPNSNGLEACVTIGNRNGKWKDDYCLRQFKYVCMAANSPVNTTEAPVQETWGCPDNCTGCVVFRDHCYYFSPKDDKKNWQQAEETCNRLYFEGGKGFRLISIHDSVEQDFVLTQMAKDQASRWIGLHEDPTKKEFLYSDGTKVDFSHWNWGEPNFHRFPVCTSMLGPAAHAGRWNDHECTDLDAYICKMRRDPKFTKVPALLGSKCAPGFASIGDACFKVIKSVGTGESVDQGQDTCYRDRAGTRVASIINVYENAMARVMLAAVENFEHTTEARAWIALQLEAGKLSWQRSRCYPSFNNIPGFYNMQNLGKQRQCASMKLDGKWSLENCDTARQMYTICEYRTKECAQIPAHYGGVCPGNFPQECGDYCYKIEQSFGGSTTLEGATATYENAKSACGRLGGTLASIRNEEDQICLHKYVEHSRQGLWIGLTRHYDVTTRNYTWKWLDPDVEVGSYEHWAINEPSLGSTENCGVIEYDGFWYNDVCGWSNHRGYVCEAQKLYNDTTTVAPSTIPTTVAASELSTAATTIPLEVSSTVLPVSSAPTTSPFSTPEGETAITGPAAVTPSVTSGEPNSATEESKKKVELKIAPNLISGGGLAGVAVAILILVPALTYIGYYFVGRRSAASVLKSQRTTFRKAPEVDEEPVIDHDEFYA